MQVNNHKLKINSYPTSVSCNSGLALKRLEECRQQKLDDVWFADQLHAKITNASNGPNSGIANGNLNKIIIH
jgi:hypothetical protein